MSFEATKRQGIIIWVYTLRQLKNLRRFGYIHYVSNRLKYIVMYVDKDQIEEKIKHLNSLHYVRKVERSYRPDIDMTFSDSLSQFKKKNETVES
ncbi:MULTISPECIES: YlbG family protein [unclassified Jeotgalibaca]|uniref:YlbG family protein n=1 Tax=unclassified Jeotgalibaca TaxID=2621505 RepID=UPI003FD333FE